ncbi:MAG: hypothetical protein Q8N63_03770, partial [Nanoarchaeota archaeon]|nr:hypothetical protein [Nanoarchaeota archaeon]
MGNNLIKKYRVRRSVNPTNRIIAKRARDSSGPIPLWINYGKKVYKFFGCMKNDNEKMDKKMMRKGGGMKPKTQLQDSKMGRKGLEVGKRFRTRFWEGLFGGKLALNPEISPKISLKISQEKNNSSHTAPTAPRRDIINISGKNKVIGAGGGMGGGIGSGLCRTRSWEGVGEGNNLIFFAFIIFILSILLISLLSLILVSSQTNESNGSFGSYGINGTDETILSNESVEGLGVELNELSALEDELDNLTSELINNNYEWLVNYDIEYPFVSVFRENSNLLLAEFRDILGGSSFNKYQIFLTNLNENESLDVFDLRSFGGEIFDGFDGVEYDYIVDPSLTFMSGTVLVTLNSPVNNSNFNVNNVTFNVTSNDTLNWCGVSINGLANVTMGNTSSTAFNYTNTSIADGSYNFIITCNDTAGTYGNSGLN